METTSSNFAMNFLERINVLVSLKWFLKGFTNFQFINCIVCPHYYRVSIAKKFKYEQWFIIFINYFTIKFHKEMRGILLWSCIFAATWSLAMGVHEDLADRNGHFGSISRRSTRELRAATVAYRGKDHEEEGRYISYNGKFKYIYYGTGRIHSSQNNQHCLYLSDISYYDSRYCC